MMSLLNRRRAEPSPEPAPAPALPPDQVAAIQREIDNHLTGSFRRRYLMRLLDPRLRNGRAVGPSAPPTLPEPQPVVLASDGDGYHAIVVAAIRDLDQHVAEIGQRLDGGRCGDFESQELLAERRDLARVRAAMIDDLRVPPLLTANQLRYLAFRTRESRQHLWANAERESRAGEHRQARMFRMQSLCAYREVERELGVRHAPLRLFG